jgi:hypothetical protein
MILLNWLLLFKEIPLSKLRTYGTAYPVINRVVVNTMLMTRRKRHWEFISRLSPRRRLRAPSSLLRAASLLKSAYH